MADIQAQAIVDQTTAATVQYGVGERRQEQPASGEQKGRARKNTALR